MSPCRVAFRLPFFDQPQVAKAAHCLYGLGSDMTTGKLCHDEMTRL